MHFAFFVNYSFSRLSQNNGILKYSDEWKNYGSESEKKEEKTENKSAEKEKTETIKEAEQKEEEKKEIKEISAEKK